MTSKLNFFKMSGAGNDFVLLNWPHSSIPRQKIQALARKLCDRRSGVGADGLLLVSGAKKQPRLDYFNADGSEAFCGNGARCAAWWLFSQGGREKEFSFESSEGRLQAQVKGPESVAIHMPNPHSTRLNIKLKALGKNLAAHYINTGVPHAVVVVKNLDNFPVFEMGRALRHHKAFAPAGANVDFISLGSKKVFIRTYERGVEDETLACGTGAVAAALIASLLKKWPSSIPVYTRGKDKLEVLFEDSPAGFRNVWLKGPAQIIFQGEITA